MVDIEDMVREIKKKDKEEQKTLEEFLPSELRYRSYTQCKKEALPSKKHRVDGRKDDDHRKMFIQLGTVSDARGSCYIELGDTKVIVSVRGPKEIPNIQEYTELGLIESLVEYAPFVKKPTSNETYMSEAIRLALEPVLCRHKFPNLQITVSTFVVEDGGSTLSTAIVASSLALAHARLPIFGILTSASLAFHNDRIITDPTKIEEDFCSNPFDKANVRNFGLITMAFMPDLQQITFYDMNGSTDPDLFSIINSKLINQCNELRNLCAQHLEKELKISTKNLAETIHMRNKVEDLNINKD